MNNFKEQLKEFKVKDETSTNTEKPQFQFPKGMPRIYVSQTITDDCKYQEIKVTMTYRYPLSYFEKMYENRVVKKLSEVESKKQTRAEKES